MVSPLRCGPSRSAGLVRGIVRPPAQRGRARAVPALPSAAGGRWHTASADAKDLGDGYASERMPAHGVTHSLERHHEAFGGTIVQRLGDGSMSMFPSSLAAVLAAIAIQRELAAQDVPARIGVHVGDVLVEPERLTGDAVNIAARIESFAVPGGVMLSDSAYEQIKNRSDFGVVHLGRFRLKNVGRP